jgi:chromatin remodeling complex protein RSC6
MKNWRKRRVSSEASDGAGSVVRGSNLSTTPDSSEVSAGRFWLISSRVVLYSLPMSNESKAKSAFMKPVQPDAALAKIVGANPLPRTELTKKLWEYIKQNKLQDKKLIKADAALETVFNGKKEVDMFELTRLVNTHIIK